MKRLSECPPGQGGVILEVNGEGSILQRLMEMGLLEGTRVEVIKVAPLGDPIEIEVRGYKLSLRKSEADCVEIEA